MLPCHKDAALMVPHHKDSPCCGAAGDAGLMAFHHKTYGLCCCAIRLPPCGAALQEFAVLQGGRR